jgi:Fibronectin type III domain
MKHTRLLLLLAGSVLAASSRLVLAATLTVPTDFATIQAAVNAAQTGDTVLIEPGTYTENIALRAGVDVAGREAARTWLGPQDDQLSTVTSAGLVDLRLSNLTLIDSSTALTVIGSTDVTIANIVFDGAGTGISIDGVSTADIVNNVFFANATAISRGSSVAEITNNIFRNNDITITSLSGLVNPDANVESNCWSGNLDLLTGGLDGSYGVNPATGDPRFVDTDARDFHLQQGSPCIDIGIGTDVIDNTVADAGAYGGELADAVPFPVGQPTLADSSTASPPVANVDVSWPANDSYLVTNLTVPGGYRIHYKQNVAGPPYDGTDANGAAAPSPIDVGNVTRFTLANLSPAPPQVIAPRLLSAEGFNGGVGLTWEAVPNAQSYRVHYGIDSTAENDIVAGNVTKFTVTGLTNGTVYRFSVGALTQARYFVSVTAVDNTQNRNESAFSEEASVAVGSLNESPESAELTALPELILPYPPLRDEGGCFIATAAFGADWAPQVMELRAFRDRYLLTNELGRWFVAQYYRLSPPLADRLRDKPFLKGVVRWMLMPAVGFAAFMVETPGWIKTVVFALVFAIGLLIMVRRYTRRRHNVATS